MVKINIYDLMDNSIYNVCELHDTVADDINFYEIKDFYISVLESDYYEIETYDFDYYLIDKRLKQFIDSEKYYMTKYFEGFLLVLPTNISQEQDIILDNDILSTLENSKVILKNTIKKGENYFVNEWLDNCKWNFKRMKDNLVTKEIHDFFSYLNENCKCSSENFVIDCKDKIVEIANDTLQYRQ